MTCFIVSSRHLVIAPGTSSAWPRPAPTWPRPSPTTTIAENEKRRPPFTTLDTRLIWTTRSVSSSRLASIRAISSVSGYVRTASLKPQSSRASAVAQRLDPPVIAISAAIEDRGLDPLRLRALAKQRSDGFGPLALLALAVLRVDARRGDEGPARVVVDELRVDVRERAEHGETRPVRAAADLLAHALVPTDPALGSRFGCHYVFAAPTLPALPALRRMYSPAYFTPFALYGSGSRRRRIFPGTSPTPPLSTPATFSFSGVSPLTLTPPR